MPLLSGLGLFVSGFASAFLVTGTLALPVSRHASWNLTQGAVFGHPVSGDLEGATDDRERPGSFCVRWRDRPFAPLRLCYSRCGVAGR